MLVAFPFFIWPFLFVEPALPHKLVLLALDAAVSIGQEPGAQKVDDAQA